MQACFFDRDAFNATNEFEHENWLAQFSWIENQVTEIKCCYRVTSHRRWFLIRFIISFLYFVKTDTFDRAERNAQGEKPWEHKNKTFHGQHQPRRWHNRWTFGAGIIKVDVLRAEILTDAPGPARTNFGRSGSTFKSRHISIPADRAVEPLPFVSDSLIEARIDRLLGHLDIEAPNSYLCELPCVKRHSHPMICSNLHDNK